MLPKAKQKGEKLTGERIRKERDKRGLSQANLARLLSMSQPKLSQWETGKCEPSANQLEGVWAALAKFDAAISSGDLPNAIRPRSTKRILAKANGENEQEVFADPSESKADRRDRLSAFKKKYKPVKKPVGIALFSGCGGMSLGFKEAGFHVPGFVELKSSARRIYEANFQDAVCLGHDVRAIEDDEVRQWKRTFGHVDVLFGGPPCQGFSLTGKRNKFDPRNQLYSHFARIASILKPAACVLENVRLLTSMKSPDGSLVIDRILEAFAEAGYNCTYRVVNAHDYGVPQSRERVIVIAHRRKGPAATFPLPTHGNSASDDRMLFDEPLKPFRTFRDACGDLESLESGEKSEEDKYHFAVKHPEHVIRWLKDVPEGESAHNNDDPELRPPSGYNTTYKRLCWDEPSSTVSTTFGMISGCRNVHPENTRSLTIREAARCQTFPDDFEYCGTLGDIRTAIGNAVPPMLANAIASHLLETVVQPKLATC